MEQIIETGDVERGWLGIQMDASRPGPRALEMGIPGGVVVIDRVLEDGPAQQAGLDAGDIITAIGGRTTENLVRLEQRDHAHQTQRRPSEIDVSSRNGKDVTQQTRSAILSDLDDQRTGHISTAARSSKNSGSGSIPRPLAERLSATQSRRQQVDASPRSWTSRFSGVRLPMRCGLRSAAISSYDVNDGQSIAQRRLG